MSDRHAKPTQADKDAAKKLKAIWDQRGRGNRPTQEEMADRLGSRSQGLVSQYLNGDIPINFKTLLIFSKVLGVRPEEIRTDLPELLLVHEFWDVRNEQIKSPPIGPRWPFSINKQRFDELDDQTKLEIEKTLEMQIYYYESHPSQRTAGRDLELLERS